MNRYQYDKIVRDMKNIFGGIKKGREEQYEADLNILEIRLLTIIEEYGINGRQFI